MADCPEFKKKMTSSFKPRKQDEKKAYKATWDSESESEDEEKADTANMCFMANTPKVNPQTLESIDDNDDELSKEVLVHAFVELSETYDNKKMECFKLQKEVAFLKNQLALVTKEKDDLSSNLVIIQNEFDAYKISCKGKTPIIDNKEISSLKSQMSDFEKVLKDCAFNTKKLEEKFSKKNTSHDKVSHAKIPHAHTSNNTSHAKSFHAHNANAHKSHTHYAFKYGRVYRCTYCGKNGHLAKFCYDKLHSSNNLVWVNGSNPHGPKKMWVPKSSPKMFDVGTHQGSKT